MHFPSIASYLSLKLKVGTIIGIPSTIIFPFPESKRSSVHKQQSIIREAAVHQTAYKLLPGMVPKLIGFVAINDPVGTFMPFGLVIGECRCMYMERLKLLDRLLRV